MRKAKANLPRLIIDSPTLSIWESGTAFLVTERDAIRLGGERINRVYHIPND